MPFKLHRPSFVKNTPLLNALTSRGSRDADRSSTTSELPPVATSPAPSIIGRYASRVTLLRRIATQQAASNHRTASPAPSNVATETDPNLRITPSVSSLSPEDSISPPLGSSDSVTSLNFQANHTVDDASLPLGEERIAVDPHVALKDELVALGEIPTMNTDSVSQREEAMRRLNNLSTPPRSLEACTELLEQLQECSDAGEIQQQTYRAYADGLAAIHLSHSDRNRIAPQLSGVAPGSEYLDVFRNSFDMSDQIRQSWQLIEWIEAGLILPLPIQSRFQVLQQQIQRTMQMNDELSRSVIAEMRNEGNMFQPSERHLHAITALGANIHNIFHQLREIVQAIPTPYLPR